MIFCLAILFGAATLQINQVMTDQERDAMGLGSATEQQRQAFEEWLTFWTSRVIDQAPTYHPSQTISSWVQSWPAHANPTTPPQSQLAISSRKSANSVLFRNYNGKEIELKDGSIWKVVAYDAPQAQYWQRGDNIIVEKSEDVNYPYMLKNLTLGKQAKVDRIQQASPSGQRNADHPSYFTGSVPLQRIVNDGTYVTAYLQNGTTWAIAPEDQYRATHWKPKDRIKVESNELFLYSYTLKNLDSGEEARGDKKVK